MTERHVGWTRNIPASFTSEDVQDALSASWSREKLILVVGVIFMAVGGVVAVVVAGKRTSRRTARYAKVDESEEDREEGEEDEDDEEVVIVPKRQSRSFERVGN